LGWECVKPMSGVASGATIRHHPAGIIMLHSSSVGRLCHPWGYRFWPAGSRCGGNRRSACRLPFEARPKLCKGEAKKRPTTRRGRGGLVLRRAPSFTRRLFCRRSETIRSSSRFGAERRMAEREGFASSLFQIFATPLLSASYDYRRLGERPLGAA
jgi:hypothetical protein